MTDIDNARMKLQYGTGRRATALDRVALVLRKAAALMGKALETSAATVSAHEHDKIGMGKLDPPPQIGRLSDVVDNAARHSARAQECHEGASVRVDAALYELEQLKNELSTVIDPRLLARTSGILEVETSRERGVDADFGPRAEVVKAGPAGSKRSAA